MTGVLKVDELIPAMTQEQQLFVSEAAKYIKGNLTTAKCCTEHTLHDGIYSRTTYIPAGVIVAGALIKVPTTLVVQGKLAIFIGDEIKNINGYNVLLASANRKQIVYAQGDSYVTLLFPTGAKTVEEAEQEMTDEYKDLQSREDSSVNLIKIGALK